MEPDHEDREYTDPTVLKVAHNAASMEPGHEDREYSCHRTVPSSLNRPQWSPVMKTGNTGAHLLGACLNGMASMEPGHEDREYSRFAGNVGTQGSRLNGARS